MVLRCGLQGAQSVLSLDCSDFELLDSLSVHSVEWSFLLSLKLINYLSDVDIFGGLSGLLPVMYLKWK